MKVSSNKSAIDNEHKNTNFVVISYLEAEICFCEVLILSTFGENIFYIPVIQKCPLANR